MGDFLISFYKNKCKKVWIIAFVTTFVLFYIVYSYVINNCIFVRDQLSYPEFYNYENRTNFGRWFLSVACSVGSFYDLRVVNLFLACFYLAISNVLIVELFELVNPIATILSSALFTTFFSVGCTVMYTYTVDGYFMAMLFSIIPVLWMKNRFFNHEKSSMKKN